MKKVVKSINLVFDNIKELVECQGVKEIKKEEQNILYL